MTHDELIALRTKILTDIQPLAIGMVESESDQFDLLLRIIQTGVAGAEVYNKAYTVAQSIENVQDRLDSLMAIVDEIDFEVGRLEDERGPEEAVREG